MVCFSDSSSLKVTLKDERIPLNTPYGKLFIPISHIQRVEFANRLSEDVRKQVETRVADLGNMDFKQREAASAELLRLGHLAYPALLEAAEDKDLEVSRRAKAVLEKVREGFPEEALQVRRGDVVHSDDSKISGQIDVESLTAQTEQFGEVELKLVYMRNIQSLEVDSESGVPMNALADPGQLSEFKSQVGKVLAFKVRGSLNGKVLGTSIYTLDSSLSTAAVHTGLVKVGQTKTVGVRILGPQVTFHGSWQNGVRSYSFRRSTGSFQFVK